MRRFTTIQSRKLTKNVRPHFSNIPCCSSKERQICYGDILIVLVVKIFFAFTKPTLELLCFCYIFKSGIDI